MPVIQDHRAQGLPRGWASLYYYLSCIASRNIFFFIITFAVFRLSLWVQLMLYLNVKGITVLVKILATWGNFLWLFSPHALNTSGGWQGVYFFLDSLVMCLVGVSFKSQREHSLQHLTCFSVGQGR